MESFFERKLTQAPTNCPSLTHGISHSLHPSHFSSFRTNRHPSPRNPLSPDLLRAPEARLSRLSSAVSLVKLHNTQYLLWAPERMDRSGARNPGSVQEAVCLPTTFPCSSPWRTEMPFWSNAQVAEWFLASNWGTAKSTSSPHTSYSYHEIAITLLSGDVDSQELSS